MFCVQTVGSAGGDDKAYWASLLPEAAQGLQAAEAARRAPIILAPRERKQVDYKGQVTVLQSLRCGSSWPWRVAEERQPASVKEGYPAGWLAGKCWQQMFKLLL